MALADDSRRVTTGPRQRVAPKRHRLSARPAYFSPGRPPDSAASAAQPSRLAADGHRTDLGSRSGGHPLRQLRPAGEPWVVAATGRRGRARWRYLGSGPRTHGHLLDPDLSGRSSALSALATRRVAVGHHHLCPDRDLVPHARSAQSWPDADGDQPSWLGDSSADPPRAVHRLLGRPTGVHRGVRGRPRPSVPPLAWNRTAAAEMAHDSRSLGGLHVSLSTVSRRL